MARYDAFFMVLGVVHHPRTLVQTTYVNVAQVNHPNGGAFQPQLVPKKESGSGQVIRAKYRQLSTEYRWSARTRI